MRGRTYVLPQDIFDVAPDVLRHRVVPSYEALAQGLAVEQLLARLLSTIHAPVVAPSQDPTAVPHR
jgi:MoxR-like ATPase